MEIERLIFEFIRDNIDEILRYRFFVCINLNSLLMLYIIYFISKGFGEYSLKDVYLMVYGEYGIIDYFLKLGDKEVVNKLCNIGKDEVKDIELIEYENSVEYFNKYINVYLNFLRNNLFFFDIKNIIYDFNMIMSIDILREMYNRGILDLFLLLRFFVNFCNDYNIYKNFLLYNKSRNKDEIMIFYVFKDIGMENKYDNFLEDGCNMMKIYLGSEDVNGYKSYRGILKYKVIS